MKIFLFVLTIILFNYNFTFAQTELVGLGKIYPKDESSKDETFPNFYNELRNAVDERNINFIYEIIFSSIQLNQNEPEQNNIENFKKKYNLKDSANEFWITAKKLLSLGAFYAPNYDSSSFMFPSLFFFDEYNKLFGEDYYYKFANTDNLGSAVSNNVIVYNEANENSKILGTLNYEIVKIKNFDYGKFVPWYKIELKDGTSGYVKNGDIYLAIFDYYMVLKKIEGKWQLVAFELVGV